MAQPFGKIPQPLGQSNIGAELMKKLLLVKEASGILRCSDRTVYRLLESGAIEGFRIRGAVRVIAESLDRFIEDQVVRFQIENGISCDSFDCSD